MRTSIERQLREYAENGFVVLEGALSKAGLAAIRERLDAYLAVCPNGRNGFEGERTKRVYSLVARGALFARTVEHPAVLALMDRLLAPNYLFTAGQAICSGSGEDGAAAPF